MKRQIVFGHEEFNGLPQTIIEKIIAYSKKGYGFRLISRETGEELCDDAIRGALIVPLDDVLRFKL